MRGMRRIKNCPRVRRAEGELAIAVCLLPRHGMSEPKKAGVIFSFDDFERTRRELHDGLAHARLALCHAETLLIALALQRTQTGDVAEASPAAGMSAKT